VFTRQGPSFVFYETTRNGSNVCYANDCAGAEEEEEEEEEEEDGDDIRLRHNGHFS